LTFPTTRVLLVTASAGRRGAETQALQLAHSLIERGVDTRIVALSAGSRDHRLPIEPLGPRRLAPSTLWRLRKEARDVDVVIAYGSTTLPASIISLAGRRVPFVYRSVSDPARWLRGPVHRLLTKLQYRQPASVAALWPEAADSIAETFDVPSDRIRVISNARSGEDFRVPTPDERRAARDALDVSNRQVVAFVGSLTSEKQLPLAIETVAQLDETHLVIAGAGPDEAAARLLATDALGDRVTFLGAIDDVRPVLFAADALLITSSVEGMPGVAIEAALCGVPVVSTNVGALSTMAGVTVVDGDAQDLAKALQRSLATGRTSPDISGADRYTWAVVTQCWLDLIGELAPDTQPEG
jgi:glycosyltransferase involved in cell wall biosynthesis